LKKKYLNGKSSYNKVLNAKYCITVPKIARGKIGKYTR
jgi:hypothetical protein